MEKTIIRKEFQVVVWDKEYSEWIGLTIYPKMEMAIEGKKFHEKNEETIGKIEEWEIVEKDELRNLLTKTRTVISRTLVQTHKEEA